MKPSALRVLKTLRAAGKAGCTTSVLCLPEAGGARFGARVKELRDAGCVIENVRERQGSDRYWLRYEPAGLAPRRVSKRDALDQALARPAAPPAPVGAPEQLGLGFAA